MYLFIDTSFSVAHVALISSGKVISCAEVKADNTLSDIIFSEIDKLFINYSKKDITKIFVATGPGSFTGVRIGVTIAKTLAWALKCDLIAISSLEVLASTIRDEDYIKVYMDARRDYVFAGIYDKDLNCLYEDKHMLLYDFIGIKIPGNGIYSAYDILENSISVVSPRIDYIKLIKKHEFDKGINVHSLVPNYLKLTEAEENLIKKNDN